MIVWSRRGEARGPWVKRAELSKRALEEDELMKQVFVFEEEAQQTTTTSTSTSTLGYAPLRPIPALTPMPNLVIGSIVFVASRRTTDYSSEQLVKLVNLTQSSLARAIAEGFTHVWEVQDPRMFLKPMVELPGDEWLSAEKKVEKHNKRSPCFSSPIVLVFLGECSPRL